jgi:uncharacterized membrane-anchored protein YjiN (DUF445 family)
MTVEAEIAKKVMSQIDMAQVMENIDYQKIGAAIERSIISSLKDYYWGDMIADVLSTDTMEDELRKTMFAVLKNMRTVK